MISQENVFLRVQMFQILAGLQETQTPTVVLC